MKTFNESISPYLVAHLQKSGKGLGTYQVYAKEGNKFPTFLGKPTTDAFCRRKEYMIWGHEYPDEGNEVKHTLYAANSDAVEANRMLYRRQEKITNFSLTKGRGYGICGNDAILIEVSKDNHYLTLRFYENAGSHVSALFEMWNHGLLQCRVP